MRALDKLHAPLVMLGTLVLIVLMGFLFYRYEQMRASATDTTDAPVLVGAGDISDCSNDNDEATAKLLDGIKGTVFTAGDNVYTSGTYAEYKDCYDPTWGRHKARTKPAPGNHGYGTEGVTGYFDYFGAAAGDPSKGYYSYDLGVWHVVVLNSMCEEVGGCEETSPQITWLKQDLATNQTACTLALWHHPLFSSGGEHGNDPRMQAAWDALYTANAELVVTGHDHDYERFAAQTPSAEPDPTNGIREFVVGTGGKSHYSLGTRKANSEVSNDVTYGVLKFTLHRSSYDWEFVPEAGKSFSDSGTNNCH